MVWCSAKLTFLKCNSFINGKIQVSLTPYGKSWFTNPWVKNKAQSTLNCKTMVKLTEHWALKKSSTLKSLSSSSPPSGIEFQSLACIMNCGRRARACMPSTFFSYLLESRRRKAMCRDPNSSVGDNSRSVIASTVTASEERTLDLVSDRRLLWDDHRNPRLADGRIPNRQRRNKKEIRWSARQIKENSMLNADVASHELLTFSWRKG